MATTNSKVLFTYVPTGKSMPATPDANTIYFVESEKRIYVGSTIIADNYSGAQPQVIITGTGDFIANITYDSQTNVLTVTKGTLPVYTITKQTTADEGYAATYQLFKDSTPVGDKINIPKDMVVEAAELKTVEQADVPYEGAEVGDKYIDLTIANKAQNHIYIPVNDLVDVYTGGTHITITDGVINHDAQGADSSTPLGTDDATHIHVSGQVQFDSLGHVISVADKDIYTSVKNVADAEATTAINALNVNEVGGTGKYIAAVSESAGVISATTGDIDSTVTASSTNLVTSGAVYTAVDDATSKWTVIA